MTEKPVIRWCKNCFEPTTRPGQVFDENGLVQISVIKGFSNPQSTDYSYEVDGLSGATITSKGVSNLLAFWLGNEGFGPFINNLKNKEIKLSDV